jgi:chorismate mutase-like protein
MFDRLRPGSRTMPVSPVGGPPVWRSACACDSASCWQRVMSDDLQRELAVVRQQIDQLDGQLLELLNQRARYAQQVGEIKARHGEAGFIYRPEREAQVLQRIQGATRGRCRTRV